jgi:glucose 1-dehydrogenase
MRSMAQELAPHMIRVKSITPGAIKTQTMGDAGDGASAGATHSLTDVWVFLRISEESPCGLPRTIPSTCMAQRSTLDGGMTLYPGVATGG